MSQLHSSDQTPESASATAGPDMAGAAINQAVNDHHHDRKAPVLPKVHSFEFRALLQAQRRQLQDEMYKIIAPAAVKAGIAGPTPPIAEDALPDTTDAIDAAMMTVIRNSQKLQEVEVALARISDGSYGICIYCGKGIDRARLKFQPTIRYCLPCKMLLIAPVRPVGR